MANKLFVTWWVLYGLTGILGKIYNISFELQHGYSPTDTLNEYTLTMMILVALIFLPLMFLVHIYAKKEKRKGLIIASVCFLVLFTIWLIGCFFKFIL